MKLFNTKAAAAAMLCMAVLFAAGCGENQEVYEQAGKDLEAGLPFYAFFGTMDHYKRSGVVQVGLWEELFGKDTYQEYEGTHFMEEEYVRDLLVPKIREMLGLQK